MIEANHPPEMIWNYTPFQAEAFVWMAGKRRRREEARALSIAATAYRADAKDINRRIAKDWNNA